MEEGNQLPPEKTIGRPPGDQSGKVQTQTHFVEQTPPPSQDQPQEASKKSPTGMIIGILLLLLLTIGGYFAYTQGYLIKLLPSSTPIAIITPPPTSTPDSTADWETYTDEKNGGACCWGITWGICRNSTGNFS